LSNRAFAQFSKNIIAALALAPQDQCGSIAKRFSGNHAANGFWPPDSSELHRLSLDSVFSHSRAMIVVFINSKVK
jgi:hypothetical protein